MYADDGAMGVTGSIVVAVVPDCCRKRELIDEIEPDRSADRRRRPSNRICAAEGP